MRQQQWNSEGQWEPEHKRGVFEKLMGLLGIESEEVVEEVYPAEDEAPPLAPGRERAKIVALQPGQKTVRLVVLEPKSFDEVQAIVDHLKNRRPVIINMEDLEKVLARRIADFVGGAVYAMDGTMQKVSSAILLFTPPHVEVSLPPKTEVQEEQVERPERTNRTNISPERPFIGR